MKKYLKALIGSMAIASCLSAAAAVPYPERPIKLIVPFAPGGSVDAVGRLLADELSKSIGQQVIVENKPGAGGTLGADVVAKSPADGYTLLLASPSHQTFHPLLYKLPYDAHKDFTQVALFATVPNVLVVSNKLPVHSVQELIHLAKSRDQKLFMGSSGAGGVNHLIGELFQQRTGVKFEHVPYKGAGLAVNDLIGGLIDLMFVNSPTVLSQIQAGRLRALAVASDARSPLLPNVPTMAEADVPDFVVDSWSGVLAPAGTPAEVIDKLSQAITKIASSPQVARNLAEMSAEPRPGTSKEYRALVDFETKRWTELINAAHITLD